MHVPESQLAESDADSKMMGLRDGKCFLVYRDCLIESGVVQRHECDSAVELYVTIGKGALSDPLACGLQRLLSSGPIAAQQERLRESHGCKGRMIRHPGHHRPVTRHLQALNGVLQIALAKGRLSDSA